jgi:hypothetical protein
LHAVVERRRSRDGGIAAGLNNGVDAFTGAGGLRGRLWPITSFV